MFVRLHSITSNNEAQGKLSPSLCLNLSCRSSLMQISIHLSLSSLHKSKSSPSKSYREKLRTVDQAKKDYSRRLLSAQSTHKKKSSPPTSSSNHPLLFQRAVERSLELIQAALADPNGTSFSKLESLYRKLCWIISKHRQAGQINLSQTHRYLERLGPALKSGPDSSLKRTIPADVERELREWKKFLERRPSLPLQPAPSAEHSVLLGDFTSDASATGVGVTYDSQFYGFWKVRPGFWNQINQNIAVLELIGVEMLVRSIVSTGQRNVTVSCRCDNTAVCDLLEPGRETPRLDNSFMRTAFDRLRQLLEINSIQIQCTWIPTEVSRGSKAYQNEGHILNESRSLATLFPLRRSIFRITSLVVDQPT